MSGIVPFPSQSTTNPNDFNNVDMKIDIPRGSKEESISSHRRQSSAKEPTHHPRQPGPQSDSYFPGSTSHHLPKTPAGATVSRGSGHSRNMSAFPMSINLGGGGSNVDTYGAYAGGPPSPSTLTDVILGLHSTLYSGKRKPEEVRQMVGRYYERGAVFESPLLSTHGRSQIANQFMMAFALPGIEVHSELRDVICSDFEFDGTRAGILDHTITVTLFPSIFGSATATNSNPGASDASRTPRPAGGAFNPMSANPITPHPFADYGAQSAFSRTGQSAYSHPHSPTTPFSTSSMWGNSRPHTPGPSATGGIRPLSSANLVGMSANMPPSVNGDDFDGMTGASQFVEAEAAGGQLTRPAIPADALQPHWSAEGLGRQTFRGILWGLFHPRAALKSLCSIQLRVMSRLEFNDAGLIVRHEDTWGLRETIEGFIPFASLIYAIERRVVGFFISWAVDEGFRLSSALLHKAINGPFSSGSQYDLARQGGDYPDAHDAARALLERNNPHHRSARDFYTISRSRATSPNRFRFGSITTPSGTVTGTRSRARSLVGQQTTPSMRNASIDNLAQHFVTMSASVIDGSAYRRPMDLPPDSGAKFRERSAKRLEGGCTSSINSAPATSCEPSDFGAAGNLVGMWEQFSNNSSRACSVAEDRTPSRAPDQDLQ